MRPFHGVLPVLLLAAAWAAAAAAAEGAAQQQPEPAGGQTDESDDAKLREELAGMKVSALKQRARAEGVDESTIGAADDAESPRGALTELLLKRRREGPRQAAPGARQQPAAEPSLTTGAEQYDTWTEWGELYTANDGIEQLYAKDFAPPSFYLRDSPDKLWVVLYCRPTARACAGTAGMYKEFAALVRADPRVKVGLVNLGSDARVATPESDAAGALGVLHPASIQVFHYSPTDYAAGVTVPLYKGRYSATALQRQVLKDLGEPVFFEELVELVSRPAISLGGATLLLAWVLYRGVTWAAASAEALVEEKTAPETAKQRDEVASIATGTLEARRKRQEALLEQKKAAAAALKAERAEVAAAEEEKQRKADVAARNAAQLAAQVAVAEGGEKWKEAEKRKRAQRLADAQEKLRKMRGETPESLPFAKAGQGYTLSAAAGD